MTELLQCDSCGEPFGTVRLVYLNENHEPICDNCRTSDVAAIGYVQNWKDKPMGGKVVRQEIAEVKEVPSLD